MMVMCYVCIVLDGNDYLMYLFEWQARGIRSRTKSDVYSRFNRRSSDLKADLKPNYEVSEIHYQC